MHLLCRCIASIFVLIIGVYSKKCNIADCINYNLCTEAPKLSLKNFNFLNVWTYGHAFCGFHHNWFQLTMPVPKICCSVFSNTSKKEIIRVKSEDERIASHKSLELLPKECGTIVNTNRIYEGVAADLYEFPWMALISINISNSLSRNFIDFKCGGSIINKRYILTAAHCVYNKTIAGVRVGEYDINNKSDCQKGVCEKHIQDIGVENTTIHKDFNYMSDLKGINDIALLRLDTDIDFSHKNVRQICLPISSELRQVDLTYRTAVVAGWGLTEKKVYSSVLRKVHIPILPLHECRDMYNRMREFYDYEAGDVTINQMCAGTSKSDSCKGDSGGPLMVAEKYLDKPTYVQYGIISNGIFSLPGLNVDLTKFIGWILDNISP